MRYLTASMVVLAGACTPGGRPTSGDPGVDASVDASIDIDAGTVIDGADISITRVFAHTHSELYSVDPDTFAMTRIGAFVWSDGADAMTDIAIDQSGLMLGVSFSAVYRIDPTTATATRLSNNLQGMFNGLSFVPASMLGQTGADVLVGTRNSDGIVFEVDPMTGQVNEIGNMNAIGSPPGFRSSGDLVAVTGFGTAQSADIGGVEDQLVLLAPQTFMATPVGATTGFSDIWGVAYWKNKIFGFTSHGDFVTIDPATGVGTLVQSGGPSWWGAAVTTAAPVFL